MSKTITAYPVGRVNKPRTVMQVWRSVSFSPECQTRPRAGETVVLVPIESYRLLAAAWTAINTPTALAPTPPATPTRLPDWLRQTNRVAFDGRVVSIVDFDAMQQYVLLRGPEGLQFHAGIADGARLRYLPPRPPEDPLSLTSTGWEARRWAAL